MKSKTNIDFGNFVKILNRNKEVLYEISDNKIAFCDKHGTVCVVMDDPQYVMDTLKSRRVKMTEKKDLHRTITEIVMHNEETDSISDTKVTLPCWSSDSYRPCNVFTANNQEDFMIFDDRRIAVLKDYDLAVGWFEKQCATFISENSYVVVFAVKPNENDAFRNVQLLASITVYCGKFLKKDEKVS